MAGITFFATINSVVLVYLLFLLVAVQSWLIIQKICFFAAFYFILLKIEVLIKLFHEICYLFHQIVIFLYTFMKTACMLYLSLPMLLSVKSLIFYFPSVSSGIYYLFCITFGNPDACNLGECCFFHLSFCHLSFTVIDQVHIKLMEHNFILILNICSNGFFFRKCTIFFCY